MNNKNIDRLNIVQNLKDAGCEEVFIKQFLYLDKKGQINLLAKHRVNLLDKLHKSQKQIDCLDF